MALERWILAQRQKGNRVGADVAEILLDNYGDVSLTNDARREAPLNVEQLITLETKALKKFFGKEINVPEISQEALDTLAKAQELGWTQAELHFLPKITLKQSDRLPGWKVKPEDWYWNAIKDGKVSADAADLGGDWILVDGSPKPDYRYGTQAYDKDAISAFTLDNSRFNLSWDEIHGNILPSVADRLGVKAEQVRLPKAIEFNVLGNLFHPEWGQTNTWEWFEDKFEGGSRLDGGHSDDGGLSDVDYGWSDDRDSDLGFRPLVIFPSKS